MSLTIQAKFIRLKKALSLEFISFSCISIFKYLQLLKQTHVEKADNVPTSNATSFPSTSLIGINEYAL